MADKGRYPVKRTKEDVVFITIWQLKDHLDFLKDFDPRTDVSTIEPGPIKAIAAAVKYHRQHKVELGKAVRLVYAVLENGTQEEFERAVKYSMIVLDAEKHLLNTVEASEKYGVQELIAKYVQPAKSCTAHFTTAVMNTNK